MEYHHVDPATVARAYQLQHRADKLTAFRKNHSDKLGWAIGMTRRNWLTFVGCCYMAYTDLQDGRDAKKAQRMLGVNKPLSNGAVEDPVADKRFRKAVSLGMEVRAAREGDIKTLAVLGLKQDIDKRRDARMAQNRELAEKYTDLGVGAIQTNRIKTAVEMAGMLLHVSPLANNDSVRNAALGMMGASTGIGLLGERQYASMVQQRMDELAQVCPDELTTLQLQQPVMNQAISDRNLVPISTAA